MHTCVQEDPAVSVRDLGRQGMFAVHSSFFSRANRRFAP